MCTIRERTNSFAELSNSTKELSNTANTMERQTDINSIN